MRVVLAVVLLTSGVVRADETDVTTELRGLASSDRATRIAAAAKLNSLDILPASAAEQVVGFIKTEVEYAVVPPSAGNPLGKVVYALPLDPDAVAFARIKADPEKY